MVFSFPPLQKPRSDARIFYNGKPIINQAEYKEPVRKGINWSRMTIKQFLRKLVLTAHEIIMTLFQKGTMRLEEEYHLVTIGVIVIIIGFIVGAFSAI